MVLSVPCLVCGDSVFETERPAPSLPVHRKCFKCSECGRTLSLSAYVLVGTDERKLYCNIHNPATRGMLGQRQGVPRSQIPRPCANANTTHAEATEPGGEAMWLTVSDPTSGEEYLWNPETGETQWSTDQGQLALCPAESPCLLCAHVCEHCTSKGVNEEMLGGLTQAYGSCITCALQRSMAAQTAATFPEADVIAAAVEAETSALAEAMRVELEQVEAAAAHQRSELEAKCRSLEERLSRRGEGQRLSVSEGPVAAVQSARSAGAYEVYRVRWTGDDEFEPLDREFRYSALRQVFATAARTTVAPLPAPFPNKKFMGYRDQVFVETRRVLLDNFFRKSVQSEEHRKAILIMLRDLQDTGA